MKTQITIDTIFAVLFFVLFVASLVSVVLHGAWWHIGTAVICYIIFEAFRKEIKKCREED